MNRLFTICFIVLTAIEIWADFCDQTTVVYLTKPLIVISLLAVTFFSKSSIARPQMATLRTALLFALAGDIFLMIREHDFFIPGLASFLIMQWLYIRLFRMQTPKGASSTRMAISFLPFGAMAIALVTVIYSGLPDIFLKIAVIIYAASIAIMSWTAFLRRPEVSPSSFRNVFCGAVLSMVSDSLIAIGRFLIAIPRNEIWVMGTYAFAQFLIVHGVLQKGQTDSHRSGS